MPPQDRTHITQTNREICFRAQARVEAACVALAKNRETKQVNQRLRQEAEWVKHETRQAKQKAKQKARRAG